MRHTRANRVLYRIRDCSRARYDGRFAHTLGAEGPVRRRFLDKHRADIGHVHRCGQCIIQKIGIQDAAVLSVLIALRQPIPQRLRGAALDLAFHQYRIDGLSHVLYGNQVDHGYLSGLRIHFHGCHVGGKAGIVRNPTQDPLARDGAFVGLIGRGRQYGQRHFLLRSSGDTHFFVHNFQIGHTYFKEFGCGTEDPLACLFPGLPGSCACRVERHAACAQGRKRHHVRVGLNHRHSLGPHAHFFSRDLRQGRMHTRDVHVACQQRNRAVFAHRDEGIAGAHAVGPLAAGHAPALVALQPFLAPACRVGGPLDRLLEVYSRQRRTADGAVSLLHGTVKPKRHRVPTQLAGKHVDNGLPRVGRLGRTRSTVGARPHLVGTDGKALQLHIGDPIEATQPGQASATGPMTAIVDGAALQGRDAAILSSAHLQPDDHSRRRTAVQKLLLPVHCDLHRKARAHGQHGCLRLNKNPVLRAEGPAHLGDHNPDLPLRHLKGPRDGVPHVERALAGCPDRDPAIGFHTRRCRVRLHVGLVPERRHELGLHHGIGLGETLVDIALFERRVSRDILHQTPVLIHHFR